MKIKRIAALFAAVLIFACSVFVFAEDGMISQDNGERYIKIGIMYGTGAVSSVTLESANGFYLADISNTGWTAKNDYTQYKTLYVKNEDSAVYLSSADGSLKVKLDENTGVMAASKNADDRYITINGTKYRDGVAFRADGSLITVMSYVSVEHYLWGVVSSEVSYLYPNEALKAQAVCARSFAYSNAKKHGSRGFDLCNTACCQVYKPVNLEKSSIINACKATKDIVIYSKGKVVIGYYYANSGGYTMNSEDVWVGYMAHARARVDEYSPESQWNFSYSFEEIESRLASSGYNIGKLQGVQISSRSDYGAVLAMTFTGSDGSVTVSKSSMKNLLSLKTQIFSISDSENFENTAALSEPAKQSEPEKTNAADLVYVLGADGNVVSMNASSVVVLGADGKTGIIEGASGENTATDAPSRNENLQTPSADPVITSGTVYFKGYGSGHGVGMSQTGARAMAKLGKNYEEILNYYFTDIELKPYER